MSADTNKNFIPEKAVTSRNLNFPPIEQINRSHVPTDQAAYYLNRRPQTLRTWACFENGAIQPVRICGRLAWRVSDIKAALGVEV